MWVDLAEFIKENVFLFAITIMVVAGMVWMLSVQLDKGGVSPLHGVGGGGSQLPAVPTQSVPEPVLGAGRNDAQTSDDHQSVPQGVPGADVVMIRPAQLGIPDQDEARELAIGIVNAVPELSTLPKGVRAGITFFVVNPDGSVTDIPESNVSFTVESGGRLRYGVAKGINVKVRMPLARLKDLNDDFCRGVKEILGANEASVEMDLSALDRMALIASGVPVQRRCGI